jgi:hypothetical protein
MLMSRRRRACLHPRHHAGPPPARPESSLDIDADDPVEIGSSRSRNRRAPDPGIIHQDMDVAIGVERGSDEIAHVERSPTSHSTNCTGPSEASSFAATGPAVVAVGDDDPRALQALAAMAPMPRAAPVTMATLLSSGTAYPIAMREPAGAHAAAAGDRRSYREIARRSTARSISWPAGKSRRGIARLIGRLPRWPSSVAGIVSRACSVSRIACRAAYGPERTRPLSDRQPSQARPSRL